MRQQVLGVFSLGPFELIGRLPDKYLIATFKLPRATSRIPPIGWPVLWPALSEPEAS